MKNSRNSKNCIFPRTLQELENQLSLNKVQNTVKLSKIFEEINSMLMDEHRIKLKMFDEQRILLMKIQCLTENSQMTRRIRNFLFFISDFVYSMTIKRFF